MLVRAVPGMSPGRTPVLPCRLPAAVGLRVPAALGLQVRVLHPVGRQGRQDLPSRGSEWARQTLGKPQGEPQPADGWSRPSQALC